MMKETGRIAAIEADCLWVETIRQSTCNSCTAQKGCGHGLLGKIGSGKSHYVRVLLGNTAAGEFSVNDEVAVSIPESSLVSGAMIVYLVPIVTMLAGAILISQWWSDDVAVFGASVAGFIAGLGLVKWHATVNRNNVSYQPLVSADEKARGGSPVTVINLP